MEEDQISRVAPKKETARPVMGELLIKEGLVSREQLERALDAQKSQGGRLGYHLIRMGLVNVERLGRFLRESMGLIPYDLRGWVRDRSVLDLVPTNLAQFYQVVPVECQDDVLTVAIADLDNPSLIPALGELTGLKIDPVVCPRDTVIQALEHFYGIEKDPGVVKQPVGDHLFIVHRKKHRIRAVHWTALKSDSAATEWFRAILAEAIRSTCRTILIRPDQDRVRITFRTDEGMEDRFTLDERKRKELDGLIVELARLEEGRRGSRKEGRIRLQVESRFLNLHVKALRTLQGPRYHLTLHDEKVFRGNWDELCGQLLPAEAGTLRASLDGDAGMILVVGAPGAGLNAVHYALLDHLRESKQQVVAIEDYSMIPIEGISQVEVSRQDEASWPELILLALKQEPGCLAIHPVKERRSMELALLAASRRSVVAILHQPDAATALSWLVRNGFKSPLKAGVLKGMLTVASVPALCPDCKLPVEIPVGGFRTATLMTRQGCEKCLAWETFPTEEILEWMPFDPKWASEEGKAPAAEDLRRALEESGGVSLRTRLLQRAREGYIDGAEIRDYLT